MDKLENRLAVIFCLIFAISVAVYYLINMTIGSWMAGIILCLGISYMIFQGVRYSWIEIKQLLDQIDSLKK